MAELLSPEGDGEEEGQSVLGEDRALERSANSPTVEAIANDQRKLQEWKDYMTAQTAESAGKDIPVPPPREGEATGEDE